MQDFFKGKKFKILVLLLVLFFFFMLNAAYSNNSSSLMERLAGYVLTPVQSVATGIARSFGNGFYDFIHAPDIADENEALRLEISELRKNQVEFERYKSENQHLKEFMGIKEHLPNLQMTPAVIVGRNSSDRFYSFTIDKGSRDGVAFNDAVITADGIVGLISDVGETYSKVITILDTTVEIGVMDSATNEVGVTGGKIDLALGGKLMMSYLPRECQAKPGDIIITTGVGGTYPKDLVVGVVESVVPDGAGLSNNAIIKPYGDITSIESVMVITKFDASVPKED